MARINQSRGIKPLPQILAQLGTPADYGRSRGLRRHREATRLVRIGDNEDGEPIRLAPAAARAWQRMHAAAARDGVTLIPISGFRSIRRQTEIVRRKLAHGESIAAVLRVVAAPGYSEHHTGRALDISCPGDAPLEASFARTAAFRWLKRHARRFRFYMSYPPRNPNGIAYEPWHWCWHRPK